VLIAVLALAGEQRKEGEGGSLERGRDHPLSNRTGLLLIIQSAMELATKKQKCEIIKLTIENQSFFSE